ncbi:MAG TPA: hypothetical protein VFR49_06525 [Solirubrobacteraceae bacterium]|nr:hypothetical protein [Solirubrobacteraceae bacterium]
MTSSYIAVAALLASLGSAVYTYALSRQARRSLKVTTYHDATALTLQVDRMFVDHPRLRPYFYDGAPVPTGSRQPDERNRVLAAAEFLLDVLECVWDHEDEYDAQDRRAWAEWIHDTFASAPACRELYLDKRDWYPSLTKLADEGWHHDAGVPGTLARSRQA